MTVLTVNDAVKLRGNRRTIDGVSLTVSAGERVALLGHNGAGKTTLMQMILGLTPLDGGTIAVAGHPPGSIDARRLTAFLPEHVAFHRALTGKEQLRHFARLRGKKPSDADTLLERVGLTPDADRRIGTYSKGMGQRLGLAQALLAPPGLALLDEPTSGLDPIARWEFYNMVEELTAAGGAVLLSSHALTELEAKTDRIAILRAGTLVANDSLDALRRAAALPVRLRVVARGEGAAATLSSLGGQPINGHAVELTCSMAEKLDRIAAITALGDRIDDIEIVPPGLDELYRHFSISAGAPQ